MFNYSIFLFYYAGITNAEYNYNKHVFSLLNRNCLKINYKSTFANAKIKRPTANEVTLYDGKNKKLVTTTQFQSSNRNNCNKIYCNLTFHKLNTYLILTSAWFGFVEQNASTNNNFLKEIFLSREVTPCLCMSALAQ